MVKLLKYRNIHEMLSLDLGLENIDISESMSVWYEVLLQSINAEELDITNELGKGLNISNIDNLIDSSIFDKVLNRKSLKKSCLYNSDDYETFMNKPCKWVFLYDINSNELEEPLYILFNVWNETLRKWSDISLYKVNGDINNFYDKLTSKTIEIIDGTDNYIYNTADCNTYELQNLDKANDIYKRFYDREEIIDLINNKKLKINII